MHIKDYKSSKNKPRYYFINGLWFSSVKHRIVYMLKAETCLCIYENEVSILKNRNNVVYTTEDALIIALSATLLD